jgi:hypothetical protein
MKREPATDIVTFGKFRGKPEAEMLSDREYCQWLSHEPGVRALIGAAVADDVGADALNRQIAASFSGTSRTNSSCSHATGPPGIPAARSCAEDVREPS